MTWTLVGWIFIGVAAVLFLLTRVIKVKGYSPRSFPFIRHYQESRTASIERGWHQQVVLGYQLWSEAYPGLGLSALATARQLLDDESLASGKVTLATSTGSLVVFAHQIVQGAYQGGFSEQLLEERAGAVVYGVLPLAFTTGLLASLHFRPTGTVTLLGDYGPEAALIADKVQGQPGSSVFAAAGSITSQAVLFLTAQDLLLGETVYALPALLKPDRPHLSALAVEDLLRVGLIVLLVVGAVLKMMGVL